MNSLDTNIEGKVLVIDPSFMGPKFQDLKHRIFRAEGGFGCVPFTMGTAVMGTFLVDGERARMEDYMFERFATEEDVPKCPECGMAALEMCVLHCPGRWS